MNNLELEQRLLKTASGDPRLLRDLSPDLFAGEYERMLYSHLARGEDLDSFAALGRKADIEARAALVGEVRRVTGFRSAVAREEAVRELDNLRVLREGERVRDNLEAALGEDDADRLRELLPGTRRGTPDSGDYIADFEERKREQERKDGRELIKTGLCELDERTGGLKRGEVGLAVGTSSSGKSLLLLQIAASAWLMGLRVMHYGIEMKRFQTQGRLDAMLTQIEAARFRRNDLSAEQMGAWEREMRYYKSKTKKNWLHFAARRGAKLEDVLNEADRVEQERGQPLDLMVIDWLGLLRGGNPREQRWEKETRMADSLCEVADHRNLCVWTAAQSTDEGYKAKDGLLLTNVKYGRGVAELVSAVVAINATAENVAMGQIGLKCLKFRDSERGWEMLMRPDWPRNVLDTRSWQQQNIRAIQGKFKRGKT